MAAQGIGKDRKNQQQGYVFRGIDDMYNSLSRPMADAGLCILPRVLNRTVEHLQNKSGSTLNYVTIHAEFDIVSALDGSKHTIATFGEAMDSADKATNKAMSAAFKYAVMQVFCIPTEGDNDADATTHEVAPRQAKQDEKLAAAAARADRNTPCEKGEDTMPVVKLAAQAVTDTNFMEVIVDTGGDEKCNGNTVGELNDKWLAWLTKEWLPWAKAEDPKSLSVGQRKTIVALEFALGQLKGGK